MPNNITKTELIEILISEYSLDKKTLDNMTFVLLKQKAIELGVF